MYQALYRKWRPRTFDEVTGQAHITETLKTQVKTGRLSHAYLFTGTRGTGKTTCAKLLARAVNCEHPVDGNPCNACPTCKGIEEGSILDVLELDAASNNGVDHVRALRDEAIYSPAYGKKRVYIVDEVHMLSGAAFNALLKILEEPPAHLMFILATTELYKVPATVLSRCQRFSFKRLLPDLIARRLGQVAAAEQIPLTDEGAALLSRLADGSMRDALSLLDQCAVTGVTLGTDQVLEILGLAGSLETARLMEAVGRRDTAEALSIFSRLYQGGKEASAVLGELSLLARDMLIAKTVPSARDALLTGGYEPQILSDLSPLFTSRRLLDCISTLSETTNGLSRSSSRRTDAELCILRLCDESLTEDYGALSTRVSNLEKAMASGSALPHPPSGGTHARAPSGPAQTVKSPADAAVNPEAGPAAGRSPESPDAGAANAKPVSGESPEQAPAKPEKPSSQQKAPAAGDAEGTAFWPSLAASLKGRLAMPEYSVINNGTMVSGRYADGVLTVSVDSEFTRTLVSKPAVETALKDAAEQRFGAPVRVIFELKAPEKRDKLEDLLALGRRFDNIIIE